MIFNTVLPQWRFEKKDPPAIATQYCAVLGIILRISLLLLQVTTTQSFAPHGMVYGKWLLLLDARHR